MSIPTSGLAALLVVATLAVSGCGSDDGTATATQVVTVPPTTAQTTTQQSTTKAPSSTTKTTTQQTQTATTAPATTQKTQTSAPKPATKNTSASRICEPIGVGLRPGDVDTTYARITQKNNITCPQAAYVVAQWGAQQIGIDKALLPNGWKCSSGNVCSGAGKSVAFKLEYPQE